MTEISGLLLLELEENLRRDMNKLLFPNGRQEAYDRIDRMCSLNSLDVSAGIDKTPNPYWKTKAY